MSPSAQWRRFRGKPLPPGVPEPFPSREEAFLSACAVHAALFEHEVQGIANAWIDSVTKK